MKFEGTNVKVSWIDDNGKVTELGQCLNADLKMNNPEPVDDAKGHDGIKDNVCTISGTLKISKWSMFKFRWFMKKVYFITWWKSLFNKNLKVDIDNQ
jgi:hypothetical protein